MIDYLDRMLAQVILNRVDSTLFIGFQPPDDDWRTKAIPGNAIAVNVFLTDMRENRRLRSNERLRTMVNGDITEQPEPRRMDCHYLITAWSPATVTPQVDPTLDEHGLLGAIANAFANADPLRALDIFAGVGIPAGMPAVLLSYPLPVTLMPVEGFHKYAEFWGTMGRHHQPWKPAVYVVTTLPLQPDLQDAGPMVTTAMAAMLQTGSPSSAETLSVIGGAVRDSQTPPQPVPLAWVELLTPANVRLQLANADSEGRFTFAGVPSAAYRLRATGPSSGPVVRDIDVPSPSGEYDLQL
jgi:Pvc16 N-terminal domain